MTRTIFILTTCLATLVAWPAFALGPQSLRGVEEATEFCKYSAPRAAVDADREAYDASRRRTAQRPVEVWLGAAAAPVIEYDRVTGALELSVQHAARFADGFAIGANVRAVGFELTEDRAQRLWARYEAGTARLKLTFLPLAWSDYERALCRQEGTVQVLDGDVLNAELVDEVGQTIASYRTRLGQEVELMRHHRIQGYLDTGTPVVTVSAVGTYPASQVQLGLDVQDRLKSELRTALYGCYLKGLTANGRLQGALVVKMSAREATVLVDSLHDPATRGCALERMSELPDRSAGPAILKATVIFRLEETPAL